MSGAGACWLPLAAMLAAAEGGSLHRFFEVAVQPMALVGWIGQTMFFSRFLVQWLASERVKRSTIPLSFWYLSLGGGVMLLIYALWRHDPVITVGQLVGLFVYIRNLILIRRARHHAAAPSPGHA